MNIAITGGTGFIGRHLVKALVDAGHNIKILTRNPTILTSHFSRVTYVLGDLSIQSSLNDFIDDVDIVFHCAGEVNDKSKMQALHIQGTEHLINAATGKIKRWVQLSSTGAYGFPRSGVISEDSPTKPDGMYETTKVLADKLVMAASYKNAFEYSILRPSVVFGSDMPNKSLFSLLKMLEEERFFFIGRPGASANYIHVENVIHALKLCAFSPQAKGRVFNLSDHTTWEDFIEMMANSLGVITPTNRFPELPIRFLAHILKGIPRWPLKPSRIDALTSFVKFSNSRIYSELDYVPCITIKNSIADLVSGYMTHKYDFKK